MATTTATDDGVLLRMAVCSNPADDTARLVYADWLQEQADAVGTPGYFDNWFGRFVRAAVLHDEYPRDGIWGSRLFGSDLYAALEPFVWTLDGRGTVYHTKGSSAQKPSKTVLHVTRGFVSAIELPCADFLAHAKAIFAAHPVVAVRLTDKWPEDLGYGWGWFNEPHDAGLPSIPDELWHEANGADDDTRWVRANPPDCVRALCLRCVAYGRERANLPPLPAEVAA